MRKDVNDEERARTARMRYDIPPADIQTIAGPAELRSTNERFFGALSAKLISRLTMLS